MTHKQCPEPWVRNPRLWEKFKTMLTEEVEDMTEAQTRAIAKQEIANAENAKKVYNTVDAVPAWGKATVQKLVNKGFLQGDDKGKLALTTDLLRLLVIKDVGRCVFIGCEARKCVAPDFLYKGKDMR